MREKTVAKKDAPCPISILKRMEGQDFEIYKLDQSVTNYEVRDYIKSARLVHDNEDNGSYNVGNNAKKRARQLVNGTYKKVPCYKVKNV
jgi:hypothetical protein